MIEIPKKYEPEKVEDKWYKTWLDNKCFKSVPDEREPYTIVIPPPNVTGVLHMGHMLNNTIQDVLVRRARMLGKNACWVPGTDHASIATEAKVVNKLRDQGIKKSDLSREEFLQHAWDWTEKHGGIILEQLKKLGASCDWDRTRFTMDERYYNSVIDVFIDLFNKGKIYRGVRMINWDPLALTALSDEEVFHKEVNSRLFYVRYKIDETDDEWVTIATTRPETILADTAVCVNPEDPRYKHLVGKKAIIPLVNRKVPVIADNYIDIEFGTGCLKVTPAHDINDYELSIRHNLEVIDILNDNGTLNENGLHYAGQDRFKVRKEISKELDELGYLVKIEDHINKVGFSERTDAVIEPKLSLQWFVRMEDLAKPALENVMNDNIKFYPPKFKNTYRHWMENIKDWCISRQLWWGHRIPAYYYGTGPNDFVVAKTIEEALIVAEQKAGRKLTEAELRQDEDVLDTWFSSWLWPISVFDGFTPEADKKDINYYYPTNDLVTAPEIMFFWVARMIIAGYEYKGDLPFRNVYYTGIVRDKLGRKMSKSLGNSPDPLELIAKYGADGVRIGMLLSSPAGNDLLFDSSLCEQGRNFSNKVWNAFRLVKGWRVEELEQPEGNRVAIEWFKGRFNKGLEEINEHFEKFRISDALMTMYKLVWDDFCSWYLEMIKPGFEAPIDQKTLEETTLFFEGILRLMHPFMPFISEEIWSLIREREEKDLLILASWPKPTSYNEKFQAEFDIAEQVISNIRTIRNEKNIAPKVKLDLVMISGEGSHSHDNFNSLITKLCNLSSFQIGKDKPDNAYTFVVKSNQYFVPFGDAVDPKAELDSLKKELEYTKGFLNSVERKLSNERFVSGAPANVVETEKKKKADALAKIKVLEEKINSLA